MNLDDSHADELKTWLSLKEEPDLRRWEDDALNVGFGSELERRIIAEERARNIPILSSGRIRQEYVRRYSETSLLAGYKLASAG
jgi:hypothetical protein